MTALRICDSRTDIHRTPRATFRLSPLRHLVLSHCPILRRSYGRITLPSVRLYRNRFFICKIITYISLYVNTVKKKQFEFVFFNLLK